MARLLVGAGANEGSSTADRCVAKALASSRSAGVELEREADKESRMAICPKCGFNLEGNESECPRCGVITAKARSRPPRPRRSELVAFGILLILVSIIASIFLPLQEVLQIATTTRSYGLRMAFLLLVDLLRLCYLIGIGALVIGMLRNRRWKAEAARDQTMH